MGKFFKNFAFGIVANIISIVAFSQHNTVKGKVIDISTAAGVPAVSVIVQGTGEGTYTDDNGNFSLTTNHSFPVTLIVSSIGYFQQEVSVKNALTPVSVLLRTSSTLGQDIVVSATRTPSRILESPVTIERISAANIRNSPAVSYYDMIGKLKGVDMVTSSLTFSTPSTRGFNGSGNLRLNQIVDGMDNQAPGLNFSVGSVVGLTELDLSLIHI